ncbi:MAG: 50S ribosomal protein L32 [Thermoplasmata archaeon]|nr:50S ribosomal protein L32 [Thermoplasmata archaeon]
MAVPKRKTSKARRGKRRSHDRHQAPQMIVCSHCGSRRMTHRVCPSCGYYNNAPVTTPKEIEG